LAGSLTKRDALIARALLAQRLNVIDGKNSSIGSRIDPQYLDALQRTDQILASAPDGLLSPELSQTLSVQALGDLEVILALIKAITVEYQQELNKNIVAVAQERKERAETDLLLLISLMFLTSIFLIWVGRSIFLQLRKTQKFISEEVELLNKATKELANTQVALRSLEELNESKNAFISTVNHELRTPLTSIIGYADLLRDGSFTEQNPEIEKFVSVISKNAAVLLDLVESILSLSKLDANQAQLPHEEIDLRKIIEKAVFVLLPQAETMEISIEIEASQDLDFKILGNSSQLSQVFVNLISNAIKFSPQASSVLIRLERVVSETMLPEIQVSIIDKGIGIPAIDIPELFHRFFRASNVTDIPGTGLGLPIVAKLIDLHGATIRVESLEYVGSTFIVTFPALLTSIEKAIQDKRGGVLSRAIEAIDLADLKDLPSITHQMAGAVGLYGLDQLGDEINTFNNWMSANPMAEEIEIFKKRETLLMNLQSALAIIKDQEKTDAR